MTTIDSTHAATVERHKLGPCELEATDWPYDCESKRRHPDHVVTTCKTHGAWWHAPRQLETFEDLPELSNPALLDIREAVRRPLDR